MKVKKVRKNDMNIAQITLTVKVSFDSAQTSDIYVRDSVEKILEKHLELGYVDSVEIDDPTQS
jgi:hypothetical protein